MTQWIEKINNATSLEELENIRIDTLGKKGILTLEFAKMKSVPNEEKKAFAENLNKQKELVTNTLESKKIILEKVALNNKLESEKIDVTRFNNELSCGATHPVVETMDRIIKYFQNLNFAVEEGPLVEDDFHNFEALNLPKYHPARDMQDTFFIEQNPDVLLRTHTSSVQIRHMEENQPPIRILSPGRVFRNEAISSRSHCIFHQIEGLYIDENVSFADLKQTLQFFTTELFGKSKIRMRPSYFPFTEPSAEVDVYWGLNSETDYRITKGTGWLEIMGCGMVDPAVLKNVNIDADKYSGYAFGMGIERIVMLLYQLGDIRMFFENDKRMLEQFGHL